MWIRLPFKIILLILSLTFSTEGVLAQQGSKNKKSNTDQSPEELFIQIDRIFIIGNRKTKNVIIERELDLREGEFYLSADFDDIIQRNRQKLINTQLFLSVEISVVEISTSKIDIIIRLTERWYFWPIPLFQLGDRNFSEWWINQNRDLSRLEYGLKFRQFNFRGMNETISLTAQMGFTRLFQLIYDIPYIDRNQKFGLLLYGDYANNRDIAARTEGHRLDFIRSDEVLRERIRTGFTTTYRPSYYHFHRLNVSYIQNDVNDTIAALNPDYFLEGRSRQQFISLNYTFRSDLRDIQAYPLKGYFLEASLTQNGIGVFGDLNQTLLQFNYSKYYDLGKRLYFAGSIIGSSSFPEIQPYRNLNGLGFNQIFMRGYEIYVIEGQHYIMNNNSVRRLLFSTEKDLSSFTLAKEFNRIPLDFYITAFFDHGYVANYVNYSQNTLFTDTWLYGAGLGLDIVSFYDFVMRFEYSINKIGETGLRLNIRAAF
ncbi:MAG: BamA/TamA family outer membrane protein [Cyclobacteriaceae bacterium]|nr:BamA/TamA family outer membrane protein [Cyclobacteriaceae bacterium]